MLTRLKTFVKNQFAIRPEDNVHPEVARLFKHNAIVNTFDICFFFMADSFWAINTIMPVFAATLTDSPFIIGLMPAIVNAGWFLPQMFMAKRVSEMPEVVTFGKRMARLERIPYVFFIILALLLPVIGNKIGLIALILVMIWRGVGGGMSALPWQETMARVIPLSHRARFFGFSRVIGQLFGVVGSAIMALILARVDYPYNYALGFGVAVVIQWVSYAFYHQNREPDISIPQVQDEQSNATMETRQNAPADAHDAPIPGIMEILRKDRNFRLYIIARALSFLGNMATAFIAVYAIQTFNLNDEQAAIFTGVLFAAGIFGYALWGAIGDRIGPKKIVTYSFVAWAIALLIAIFTNTVWVYYLVFVFFGIYSAGIGVGDSMLIMELSDDRLRPTYLGMARTLTGAFLLLAPVLAGWLVNDYSYNLMFWVTLVFTLISTVLMAQVRDFPRGKRVLTKDSDV
ncbi:MAG TPA: MFS transporter [Anaerolineaceae bacterium]|nr:MFS transporter [Anaerolineaceae bacterium]HQL92450.1 MFS transporter [Anaerolineaceae bacterium]